MNIETEIGTEIETEMGETKMGDRPQADTFRHKMTDDVMEELCRFAKLHKYESREEFKESFAAWVVDSEEMIQQETDRLRANKYRGNVLSKMFKSAKYYFCNKSLIRQPPVARKLYDGSDGELLRLMNSHVLTVYNLPPKIGFSQFCELYSKPVEDVKLKKMYKNRHFRIVRENV